MHRLLDSCDISYPAVVRDYAILMLVARVGLRSIKAARLQLGDRDFAGWIALRGKASREDGIPLPDDVVEALSTWLRRPAQRPRSRRVKVRSYRFGHHHQQRIKGDIAHPGLGRSRETSTCFWEPMVWS